MSIFVGIFVILHALVHMLYAGQALHFFELRTGLTWPDGSWAFASLLGITAANAIAKTIEKKGGQLAAPREGFFVTGEQGPLKEGELERARSWASTLVG